MSYKEEHWQVLQSAIHQGTFRVHFGTNEEARKKTANAVRLLRTMINYIGEIVRTGQVENHPMSLSFPEVFANWTLLVVKQLKNPQHHMLVTTEETIALEEIRTALQEVERTKNAD